MATVRIAQFTDPDQVQVAAQRVSRPHSERRSLSEVRAATLLCEHAQPLLIVSVKDR